MSGPDGPEERHAFYQESYERDLDEIEIDEQLADEEVSNALDPLVEIAFQRMAMDSACQGVCDCGWPGPDYGPHDPDCKSLDVCDGERGIWCEKHWQEQVHEHGWMRGRPLSSVTGVLSDEDKQDIRDAGRGHLVRP